MRRVYQAAEGPARDAPAFYSAIVRKKTWQGRLPSPASPTLGPDLDGNRAIVTDGSVIEPRRASMDAVPRSALRLARARIRPQALKHLHARRAACALWV
jgi:hypothetical protein